MRKKKKADDVSRPRPALSRDIYMIMCFINSASSSSSSSSRTHTSGSRAKGVSLPRYTPTYMRAASCCFFFPPHSLSFSFSLHLEFFLFFFILKRTEIIIYSRFMHVCKNLGIEYVGFLHTYHKD